MKIKINNSIKIPYPQIGSQLLEIQFVISIFISSLQHLLNVDDPIALHIKLSQHFIVTALEIVTKLDFRRLVWIAFDFAVRVVDDSQEHVQEYEEYKEHVGDEVGRSQDSACLLQRHEIEVAENETEKSEP